MPVYTYNGIDGSGKFVSGDEPGDSQAEAVNRLSTAGISVTSISPKTALSLGFDLVHSHS